MPSRWLARLSALLALLSPLWAARADEGGARSLELRSGTVTYTVVHKFHEVKGTSQKLEGRALVSPDGSAKVQVRAPIASFDSGNSNRDAHMREATHELQHPYVTVRGRLAQLSMPLSAPLDTTMQAIVELNGQKGSVAVALRLEPVEGKLRGTFSFPISLDSCKIDRPELLLIRVEDTVKMKGTLLFEEVR